MKTDSLIAAISADTGTVRPAISRTILLCLALGFAGCAALFFAILGPRPDAWQSFLSSPRFVFKFIFAASIVIAALMIVLRLARPENRLAMSAWWLALPVGLMLAAVGAELSTLPRETWGATAVRGDWRGCLTFVPLLSLVPLVAVLWSLRQGATSYPALAGAFGGLLSAGSAAFLYASFCPADSPLFVGTWYPLAALVAVAAGAVLGSRLLRW